MRKPGGQQGNQNARIHGYYSKILDEDEQKYYRQAAKFVGLDGRLSCSALNLFTVLPGWWTQRPRLVRIQVLSAQ